MTDDEIHVLENNSCWAEAWQRVKVAEEFSPYNFHRVIFYGDIRLGVFEKQVEVSKGFVKHSGINDATLRNVTVGDNCLIEKIGNYINNYTIGNDCYISNICTLETTDDATYGEGSVISVLNEMGDGNVTIFRELNSQLASFMVKHNNDKNLKQTLQQMIEDELRVSRPDRGYIGNNVKIINAKDITNTIIKGDCEISGAARLSECTVMSSMDAPVFIGTGVICENSIICDGCSINNSVKMQDCFVGEACQITNGFTAEASLFFANSFMANGEACAAFCGPFSASHHKSSLLIGGEFSFYNAGSNTNFSNHAYKMGPMHYGTLERGTKTASGAYVLMPATIGAFSVCFGKLMHHPDTRNLPFSYLLAYGDDGVFGEEHIDAGAELDHADLLALLHPVADFWIADDAARHEARNLPEKHLDVVVADHNGVVLVVNRRFRQLGHRVLPRVIGHIRYRQRQQRRQSRLEENRAGVLLVSS